MVRLTTALFLLLIDEILSQHSTYAACSDNTKARACNQAGCTWLGGGNCADPAPAPVAPPVAPPVAGPSTGVPCPDPSEGLVDLTAVNLPGTVELSKSSLNKLCTLVFVSPTDGIKSVGRSYNANGWESVAGDFNYLSFDCSGSSCLVNLPLPPLGYKYSLASYENSITPRDEIARFLEQSTFGPKQAEIDAFTNPEEWVQSQLALPISSHRQHFREHVRHRHESTTNIGLITNPCEAGTRYRKFAFSEKDDNRYVVIETSTVNPDWKILSIAGQRRTVVKGPVLKGSSSLPDETTPFADGAYEVCSRPDDGLGGRIRLRRDLDGCASYMWFAGARGNPEVFFDTDHAPTISISTQLDAYSNPFGDIYFGGVTEERYIHTDLPGCTLSFADSPELAAVGTTSDGAHWIHSPSMKLLKNDLNIPLLDGGKSAVELTSNAPDRQYKTVCSNVPRTFLNEDYCTLSYDACTQKDVGDREMILEISTFQELYDGSGGLDSDEALYVYVIDDLRQRSGKDASPCTKEALTRWRLVDDPVCDDMSVDPTTKSVITGLIDASEDTNPYMRDILFPSSMDCHPNDVDALDFKVKDSTNNCWQNTHIQNLQVFDMTVWTYPDTHPGNSDTRNPIEEFAESGTFTLLFPSWHDMGRWTRMRDQYNFPNLGRWGDTTFLQQLPPEVIQSYADAFGMSGVIPEGGALTVCGSPFESANDLTQYGQSRQGGFDMRYWRNHTTSTSDNKRQKVSTWMEIILDGLDQFRSRAAWALYQIFAISPDAINYNEKTEPFVTHYDIFQRHAFGNFRDVLKENSFSPIMAEMLTYLNSQSTGSKWTTSLVLEFPDENYAREVMQLFSIGLYKLNSDGTLKMEGGEPARAYTNDEITEYARAWTGFQRNVVRGNLEKQSSNTYSDNQIDPMTIRIDYRDHLPKMGLNRQYVGDGYPLCSDLPDQHFLKTGATFLLLGADSSPERHTDPSTWYRSAANRVSLSADSELASVLCAKGRKKNDPCTFPTKVVLAEDLLCTGVECDLDTLRTFQASPGMFYEYVRQPCVHQAFYSDAKLIRRRDGGQKNMCGDPRMESGSTVCCELDGATSPSRTGVEIFSGERVSYDTAVSRCSALGKALCNFPTIALSDCDVNGGCDRYGVEYWSTTSCALRFKIGLDGKVAISHAPDSIANTAVEKMVQQNTKMFFLVDWKSQENVDLLLQDYAYSCAAEGCSLDPTDNLCVCDADVVADAPVFSSDVEIIDTPIEEILSGATIGALTPTTSGIQVKEGVKKYSTLLDEQTVLEIIDSNGISHFRKNVKSYVRSTSGAFEFRNPVHFISLSDPEVRDALHETDAVIDQYLYHENTAPFLATRFAQRFGISNPSPGYIGRVASAFRSGAYTSGTYSYGTGVYGDLAATFAALVLDPEARNTLLDADPMHGSILEPYMKIVRIMRSLEFQSSDKNPLVYIYKDLQDTIGQMPHSLQSVFSFFKPEYTPAGRIQEAALVSPESQVLTGPKAVNLMNHLLSTFKYGLNRCEEGIGYGDSSCYSSDIGNNHDSEGNTTLAPDPLKSARENIDDLATLLTSGRLSSASRSIVEEAWAHTLNSGKSPLEAYINAQQLISTTPEFHTSSPTKQNAAPRGASTPSNPTGNSYKAVVYLLLAGGCDSFNMLVPHECTGVNGNNVNVRDQYDDERGAMAFSDTERDLQINATGQPCDTFALHDELTVFKQLYDENTLSFFANTGVINSNGMTKSNYRDLTRTQLFAHNAMQEESKKVDPFDTAPGTGVLGRAAGLLKSTLGYNVNSLSIDNPSIAVDGVPGEAPAPLIVSRYGAKTFNPGASDQSYFNITEYMLKLNNGTTVQGSIYGETWSNVFLSGVEDAQNLKTYLDAVPLDSSIWYTETGSMNTVEGSELWYKFSTIYKLIQTRSQRVSDVDFLYTSYGGWDNHYQLKNSIRPRFRGLNHGLQLFTDQLKAANLWDDVTIVVTSDFARTITPNSGVGSDHAWGGQYPLLGGSVKGGLVHGEYPYDITASGPLNIGRGRIIPTLSWDAVWNGVVDHLGVPEEHKDTVLPNRHNTLDAGFNLFTKADLFTTATSSETPERKRNLRGM